MSILQKIFDLLLKLRYAILKSMEFPDCFPKNFETDILPEGAKPQDLPVYHILLFGKRDKTAFLSSYELDLLGLTKHSRPLDPNEPGTYSTSCFLDKKDADYYLELLCKPHPAAKLAIGKTEGSCGPSQITKERNPECKNSHVDWWIYKDAEAYRYFKEI